MDLPLRLNSIEDFIEDERFQVWMSSNQQYEDEYWKDWLANNLNKKELFYEAIVTWQLLHQYPNGWSEGKVDEKRNVLLHELKREHTKTKSLLSQYTYLVAAAIVVLVAALAIMLKLPSRKLFSNSVDTIELATVSDWVEHNNTSLQPLLVNLPDGSSVVLAARSELKYPARFEESKRSVYLKGEAFFEVEKNQDRPFFVYTARLITKVLGTSFRIRSFSDDETASVKVVTGKVEVKPTVLEEQKNSFPQVLLLPNEEVFVYPSQERTTNETLIEVKTSLETTREGELFQFHFAPITEVYELLQSTYHIQISYDSEKFVGCTITANLNDMPFMKKLELICESIGATYELVGSDVKITGNSCR